LGAGVELAAEQIAHHRRGEYYAEAVRSVSPPFDLAEASSIYEYADGAPVSKLPAPHFEFPAPATIRPTAISLCVASRRLEIFMNRDPRFALSQELEAKQTLLDQLRALATDDPDFFTDLLEGDRPSRGDART
jgi:hypothetical protein